jgi:hypothetical protein
VKPRHLALSFFIATVAVTQASVTTPQPQLPQPSFAKSEEALQSLLLSEQQQPVDDEVLRGIAKEYNTEILCLIAKQYADLATKAHDSGNLSREKYYTDCALGYAVRACAANPSSPLAHALLSYCYSRSAKLEGPSGKMRYARFVKSEAEKAIALDPHQDIALHVLGAWHYTVARLNPVLKEIAQTLYGSLPQASLQASADYLQRAVRAKPESMMHQAALAMTYAAMNQKEKARQALAAAEALPPKDAGERLLLAEARHAVSGK